MGKGAGSRFRKMGPQGLTMQDASKTSCKCQMGSWIEGLSPGEQLGGMCAFGSHQHKDGI